MRIETQEFLSLAENFDQLVWLRFVCEMNHRDFESTAAKGAVIKC